MRGRGLLIAFTLLSAVLSSCATDTVTEERIVVAPHALSFASSDSVKTVSVTHTCTCPFTWNAIVPQDAPWLKIAASMQGDHSDVPVSIDRSLLTQNSETATIHFTTNGYGSDSLVVTAER
jgi:hypothetical protein